MDSEIIVAILALAGTLVGSFGGILASAKLSNFRISQLEKKVEKHNSIIERTYKLEEDTKHVFNEIDEIRQDIRDLKTKRREG